MKNHKATLMDGTVIFYSDPADNQGGRGASAFYYFFAFPADGSMHYGRRSAADLPTSRRFDWQEGNESLRKLK